MSEYVYGKVCPVCCNYPKNCLCDINFHSRKKVGKMKLKWPFKLLGAKISDTPDNGMTFDEGKIWESENVLIGFRSGPRAGVDIRDILIVIDKISGRTLTFSIDYNMMDFKGISVDKVGEVKCKISKQPMDKLRDELFPVEGIKRDTHPIIMSVWRQNIYRREGFNVAVMEMRQREEFLRDKMYQAHEDHTARQKELQNVFDAELAKTIQLRTELAESKQREKLLCETLERLK